MRAPRRVEVSFGEDPAAEQWQMRNAAWAQAAKAAGLSDFAAGAVAGQVLAGMDAAVKGGEAIDDVLAVLPDLAQELATKPNASASRLDIPLRRLHARRAAEQPPPVVRRAPPLEPEPETAEELAAWNDERTRRMREQMVNPPVDEPSTVVCLDLSARVSALAARMGAR